MNDQAEIERILRERARELARVLTPPEDHARRGEALVVRVGNARYAVPLSGLAGVVRLEELTPLPGAPSFIAGLAHVYGHVTTVVDLGVLLGEAPEPPGAALLVEVGSGTFGLGVSAYENVISVSTPDLVPAPAGLTEAAARHVESLIGKTGVGLLRLSSLVDELSHKESTDEEP